MKKIAILITLFLACNLSYSQLNLKKLKKAKSSIEKEIKPTKSSSETSKSTKVMSQNPCVSSVKSLTKYLQKLQEKKLANQVYSSSFKAYISSSERYLKSIKSKCPDLDVSNEENQLNGYKSDLEGDVGAENNADYFRNIHMKLNYMYSETEHGADATQGLQFSSTHKKLYETQSFFKNFSKVDYLKAVENSKSNSIYPQVKFYIEKVVDALNDYPNFINKSASSFHAYIDNLNTIGIKGDSQMELKELEATKIFCGLLLKFAPNNSKATQWLKQVESEIEKKTGGIIYTSNMHKNHLNEMLFSNKEVAIGNESENDFSKSFKSGDYIYATLYLPAKLRKLTDSYAANDMEVKINGMPVAEASYTAVWVTTLMQEKNYLQFALLPSDTWKQKNGQFYIENKLRTHEAIAEQLLLAGSYSDITVEVRFIFRGTNSNMKGTFTIDQSFGVEHLKHIVSREENTRLKDAKLPKAGMQNSSLAKESLGIMQRKNGSSKTYTKSIITSVNWNYDKNWKGVIESRSLVIALVSKEHDGKCMYQYFNFKQQVQGGGKYNNNLEFAGAGDNVYISCDNVN